MFVGATSSKCVTTHTSQKAQCGVGVPCEGCGRRLPLRIMIDREEALLWECVDCHTQIRGDIAPEIIRMLSRRVRLAALHFDVEQAAPLTDALLQVVWRNSLAGRDAHHDGRRSGASRDSVKSWRFGLMNCIDRPARPLMASWRICRAMAKC